MSRTLVVNADDLGRTVGINDGIYEAHRRGLVSSATLMVGFPAARDAVARLAEHSELGVGLHLTLTGAKPTLPPSAVPSLVDGQGRLPRRPERISGFDADEVLAEMRNQLERFVELVGRPPTHLDTHHHAHRVPVVLDAVVALAREADLPVRRSSEAIAERLAREGVATTEAFVERFFGPGATLDVLLDVLARLGDGVTELMCHPGHSDDALRRESGYADEREAEIAALTHPEALAAVAVRGLSVVRFGAA